jgi:U4/U6 small nuclear ribonucleoprotein PRP4
MQIEPKSESTVNPFIGGRSFAEWQQVFEHFTNTSSQLGDDRPLGYCRLSPDNRMLATAGWSGNVRLWNVETCEEVNTFRGHSDRANCVLFHPQATLSQSPTALNMASCGADNSVLLWSLREPSRPLHRFNSHTAKVNRIAFHPSGRFLASTSDDLTWKLYDLEIGKEVLEQEGHSRAVFAVAFQSDGSLIATGGNDKLGRVWDLRSGKSIWVLRGHAKRIIALDWSPNGHHVASGSEDNTIRISDLRMRRHLYTLAAHQSLVSHVKYTDDGELLYSSAFDHTCKIFSARDFSMIRSIRATGDKVLCCDLSSDYSRLITANYDRTWRIFTKDQLLHDKTQTV